MPLSKWSESEDHLEPVWKEGRDYQLVCGLEEPVNKRLETFGQNSSKSNRFVPWRTFGVCPPPEEPGDLCWFLNLETEEWEFTSWLGDRWFQLTRKTCSEYFNGVSNAVLLNSLKTEDGRSVKAVEGGINSRNNPNSALNRPREVMSAHGRAGGTISKQEGLGIFAPGQQSAGGVAASKQRWECTVTGKVSAAGPLTGWQKARGIDPSNRVRRHDLEVVQFTN